MEKKRVLHVNIDNDGGNGAFALVRYLYAFLKEDFVFDYFTMGEFVDDLVYREIINNGGKCYSAKLRKNKLLGHIKLPFVFYKYLKNNSYEIVHIHSEVAYKHFLYSIAAKFAKVKKIVIHSHSSDIDGDNKGIKYFCHLVLRYSVNIIGTDFLACSLPAAEWMFTKKTMNGEKFNILHNGINPKIYMYSDEIREKIRKKFNVQDKILLGHVGALKKVKNQERLLDIINEIHDKRYALMLIGDGEDSEKLVHKVNKLGISEQVLFLGNRTDVSNLLQALDVFVFPSYFEGIPIALIEAQAVGVPIIASDSINSDVKINDNVRFLSLEDTNSIWISSINEYRTKHIKEDGFRNIELSSYNIKKSANLLKAVYIDVKN